MSGLIVRQGDKMATAAGNSHRSRMDSTGEGLGRRASTRERQSLSTRGRVDTVARICARVVCWHDTPEALLVSHERLVGT
jgi:hypothetical protein